ncbi:protein kinase family protein [Kitasatospora sp. NPDC050543]|uniref:protein kinase family protein n=1 Tax=Kitasatospora sp. NPDC050543 TaxID=3364054 RepID=UPI0037B079BB
MADGTKAVVDTPAADETADEAALAMAIDDIEGDAPDRSTNEASADADGGTPGGDDNAEAADVPEAAGAAEDGGEAGDGPDESGDPVAASTASSASTGSKPSASSGSAKASKPSKAPKSSAPAKASPAHAAAANATKAAASAAPPAAEETTESTAPLSASEIAAELAAGAIRASAAKEAARAAAEAAEKATGKTADKAAGPAATKPADGPRSPAKAASAASGTSADTRDTGALPRTLPAPLRHSGDKIGGRYRLEECISLTEAFSSWRAVDEKLRRAVGVHLMTAGQQRSRAALAAAKSAALLNDPRFVQVLDAVQEGELVYVVREWLPDASDLAKLLANGPMEPYDAYQMVRQVTDAIVAAHRRGQAHLRLTPRCVLRTDGGQYRINGIAVDAALRGLSAEDTEDAQLADTRAIGALLYAALTHRWPFPEDRYDLKGLPKDLGCVPPDQVRAGVHKGLAELAARTMCAHPPHHAEPITTPEQLAKAIAAMPRIRQPEPELPIFTPLPRHIPRAVSATTEHHPLSPATARPAPYQQRPARPRRRRGLRRALKLTAWTLALSAVGVASWQLVGLLRDQGHGSPTGGATVTAQPNSAHPQTSAPAAATNTPVAISDLQSFNPLGNSPEHVSQLPLAFDGDPATVWTTQGYEDPINLIKEGTGLLVDLGSAQQVSSVDVRFVGTTRVELRMPAGQATAAPAKPGGYTTLDQGSGTQVTLKPQTPVNSRYLLIWMTALPKDGDGKYRGQVAEIKVTG